jgi:organic radical activating enzyme
VPQYKQSVRPIKGSLKVVELFKTVQGEGIYSGVPSVFFRTGMCNLECSGCDTKWDEWVETDFNECAVQILNHDVKHVVFTGGEPTMHQDELANLMAQLPVGWTITVETNGAIPIKNPYLLARVNLWSFSPKVGSLGFDEIFSHLAVLDNIAETAGKNQIKYVLDPSVEKHVASVFKFQKSVDRLPFTHAVPDDRIFFQPLDTETLVNIAHIPGLDDTNAYLNRLTKLTRIVMERSGARFRVQPQLHKLLSWR